MANRPSNPMDLPPLVHGLAEDAVENIKAKAIAAAEKEMADRDQKRIFDREKALALQQMELERTAADPEEAKLRIHIQLAPHAQLIRLDGVEYHEGFLYDVSVDKARSILEIMNRTWLHEREIGGDNVNHYRASRNDILRPQHVVN